MSSEKRSNKNSKRKRTLLKGFSIDSKSCIDVAQKAIISFLQKQYLKEECNDRLVAVLYAELKNRKGNQKFLLEFYIDIEDDIDLAVRILSNQNRYIRPQEKFVVVLFLEKHTTINMERRV